MKRTIKSLLVVAFAIIIGGAASNTVLAQEVEQESPSTPVTSQERPSPARTELTAEQREAREQRIQRVERSLEKCEQIKTRLTERITKSAEVKSAHTERYERLVNRIDAVIASAESRGYDTTDLVAAKTAVTTAITAYGTAIDAFTEQLSAASEVACDASANSYGQAIVISRENLEAVRTAGTAVKTAFRQNVVPELQAYKAWLEENATATTEEESAQ